MPDICEKKVSERFCPVVRGWAALRLVSFIPRAVRDEIEIRSTPAGAAADFRRGALAVVSSPAAIYWAQEMAARVPALGVAAGPACITRFWVARLLRPGGGLVDYWTSVVDEVWAVIRPALEKIGVTTRGPCCRELRHEVAVPFALTLLKSLAAGRKDLRLVEKSGLPRPDGLPFGWAPGIDAMRPLLRYLFLGQVPGAFQSHAFLSSPLVRLIRASGLGVLVAVSRRECPQCRVGSDKGGDRCLHCGAVLVVRRERRLVARAMLERQTYPHVDFPGCPPEPLTDAATAGQLPVPERVEAAQACRQCIQRARRLWEKVILGHGHGVAARLVLGALAGVQPLTIITERPPPEPPWLETLVETLADGRLNRKVIARRANAALAAMNRSGGPLLPSRILSAYVGVLATRFRKSILGAGPKAGRLAGTSRSD